MTVDEFLKATGMSINALHKATGIAYSTLRPHVTDGVALSDVTARKLEAWSREKWSGPQRMNAALILGLTLPQRAAPDDSPPPSSRAPRRGKRSKGRALTRSKPARSAAPARAARAKAAA